MTLVVVSDVADQDAEDIVGYLRENAGGAVAASFSRRVADAVRSLARFPEKGARRLSLGPGYRALPVDAYLVIYRFDARADRVDVVRILHGSRDLPRLLPRS